ncbi:hypothetical protein Tco_0401789, partial [Tanacetum coccineum]
SEPLPPHDQRYLWLCYQVVGYTKDIVHDFEQRLEMIFGRQVNRVHIQYFKGLTRVMRQDLAKRIRMVYTWDDRQEGLFESMNQGVANVPYLLAQYLFRHVEGRKSGVRLSGGHFIGRLAHHFSLVSDDGLRGLLVVASKLPLIDMGELVKLNICKEIGDDWDWVAPGLERQQVVAASTPKAAEDAPAVNEGAQADPAPMQAPQPPPPPPTAGRTMPQRLGRLEEEICMAQLIEASGQTYQAFDRTLQGSSPAVFDRCTRQRTGSASTSVAPLQPDP